MDFGPVNGWVSDVGTLTLLGWTLWTWKKERQELREAAATERARAQKVAAGRVNAWVQRATLELLERGFATASGPRLREGAWVLVLQNSLDDPIHDWSVRVFMEPPGRQESLNSFNAGVLPPHSVPQVHELGVFTGLDAPEFEVVFEFTDPDGSHWLRDRAGLRPLTGA